MIFSEAHSGVKQQYGAIREALEHEEKMALQCVVKEEKRVLGGFEVKLGQLQSSLLSIQQGLHTLEGLADSKGDKRIQDQAFIMVSTAKKNSRLNFVPPIITFFFYLTGIQQSSPNVSDSFLCCHLFKMIKILSINSGIK